MKKMLNSASHHRNTNQNHNEAPSTPVKTSTTKKKKKKSINNKVCRACGEKDTTPAEGVQIGRRSSSRSEAKH